MIDARTLVLSTLTVAIAVVATPGLEVLVSSRSEPGRLPTGAAANDSAWALLAEADELCRTRQRSPAEHAFQARRDGTSAEARRVLAAEALDLARELAARAPVAISSNAIIQTERRLRRGCARARLIADPRWGSLRSLDGSAGLERSTLIAPFLARLNEAAETEPVPASEPIASAPPAHVDRLPMEPNPSPNPSEARGLAAAESSVERSVPSAREGAGKTAEIRIESGSARYRERIRLWSAVFDRETPALRAGRRTLQAEIEQRSLAEARAACREFGLVLARLDENLVAAAPSRGLAILVERMIARYWRGVAQCVSGRPAAAFAYLSEGDRDWVTVAQTASRMVDPRPMRPLRPVPLRGNSP